MASNGGVTSESIVSKRKQAVVSALCKRFSLDPIVSIEYTEANGIKDLFSNILKQLGDATPLKKAEEVMTWVTYADSFPVDSEACKEELKRLNEDLTQKSVLLGDGLTPSEADIVVLSALHSFVIDLSVTEREKYCNVLRWMDYIQNKEDLDSFEKLPVERSHFEAQGSKLITKVEVDPTMKRSEQSSKTVEKLESGSSSKKSDKLEVNSNSKKNAAEKKVVGDSKVAEEKKKVPEKESVEKGAETSVSLLNIQVGLIRKAWKHPSADSLLVEEIDVGDGNVRQVVSGLAKYFSPDELTNRPVVLITNVKPGKLRDVTSAGLVLCASNQDHTVVEPLLPPEGAKPGERVSFAGHEGKPEDVLNPKKKQLEKITPYLHTDDKGIATFNGIPFMTSAGPCTSSIPNASIK